MLLAVVRLCISEVKIVPHKNSQKILIVDDEVSIRKTLEAILKDEGFEVTTAKDGEEALTILRSSSVDLVLLDIWMPGRDGIEVLKEIKVTKPDVRVVMISGHATIATALSATRLGADDFIEKPLDLNAILLVVGRLLGHASSQERSSVIVDPDLSTIEDFALNTPSVTGLITPIVFQSQRSQGRVREQRTIKKSAIMYGQGLHSGKKSGLILEPLPENSGIHFAGISGDAPVPAHVDYVGSTGFATTVKLGTTQAGTIEHLMSALHAYGISNLLVKCNGEVPVMDGSSKEFCALFDQIGVEGQGLGWFDIAVPKKIRIGNEREWIQIEPADEFSIDYTLSYPAPLGTQHFTYTLSSTDGYKDQIAPARTFGFVKDIGALQKQGLALGGRFDNFVLMGEHGPINTDFRFPNEPVRHKILDAIGDLYLLGRSIQGKVTASMTGHSDNVAILRELYQAIL
jgi:UDP-3-O-[3-hydroxymyristoyl] N-acetylglucosamine deacetylase